MAEFTAEIAEKILLQNQQLIETMRSFLVPVNVPERNFISKNDVYREMVRHRALRLNRNNKNKQNV